MTVEADADITFNIISYEGGEPILDSNGVSRLTYTVDNFGSSSTSEGITLIATNTYTSGEEIHFFANTSCE